MKTYHAFYDVEVVFQAEDFKAAQEIMREFERFLATKEGMLVNCKIPLVGVEQGNKKIENVVISEGVQHERK